MSDATPARSGLSLDRVAVLWAVLGGVGGVTGSAVLKDDHQPAVIAQSVELLREDVRTLSQDLRDLRSATERNRWTRTDHDGWVRDTYSPNFKALDERVRRLEDR